MYELERKRRNLRFTSGIRQITMFMFGLDFHITNFKLILGQILARALMLIEYPGHSVANIKKIVIKLIITKIKGIHSMIDSN